MALHTAERQSYKLWGRQSGLHNIRLRRRQRIHGNAGPGWTEGFREAGGGEPQGNCGAGEYVNHEKGKGKVSQEELDT